MDESYERISDVFSTAVYVPKLDVAGSNPVSRSINQQLKEIQEQAAAVKIEVETRLGSRTR